MCAYFTKKEIRQIRFSSLQVSFPRKIIYSRFFYSSPSIPPKAIKSNSESTAENQFLIKKKKKKNNLRETGPQCSSSERPHAGDASLPVCRPGLRPAGRDFGGAGGLRGCVCPPTPSPPSHKWRHCVSGSSGSTWGLTAPLPGRGDPSPVSVSLGNSETGPAGTSRTVCSGLEVPVAGAPIATAAQAAPSQHGRGFQAPPSTSWAAGSVPTGQVSEVPLS